MIQSELRQKKINLDDCEIEYIDEGEGEILFFLHGFPQSLRMWRNQISYFSKNYRVIAPSFPGWGNSSIRKSDDYQYQNEVNFIKDFLEKLKIDKAHFILHDYAGFIGSGYLKGSLEKVTSVVFLNSRINSTFPHVYYYLCLIVCFMAKMPGFKLLSNILSVKTFITIGLLKYRSGITFGSEELESYRNKLSSRRQFLASMFANYQVKSNDIDLSHLSKIEGPVTIIWGERDQWCPVTIAQDLHSSIQGSCLYKIPNADHYLAEEFPYLVNRYISEHLKTQKV